MRVIYVLTLAATLAVALLWLGLLGGLKRKIAAWLAVAFLVVGCSSLAVAVLPGNSLYGSTITTISTLEATNTTKAAAGSVGQQVKEIALTFDDGPYPPYTQQLLEVLRQEQVKATFFIVAEQAEAYPELVRRVAAAGHTVGLHAYRHQDFLKLEPEEQQADLQQGVAVLQRLTGKPVKYWRPPHGFRDPAVMATAAKLGLQVVNWSIIPRDWTGIGPEEIAARVVAKAAPGSIVLLHDGDSPSYTASREATVQATGRIIRQLKAQGYSFIAL